MRPIRALLAGIASFVVMFLLGGIWYSVVMVSFYEKHAPANARNPQDVSLLAIATGYGLLAALMTKPFADRFKAGRRCSGAFGLGRGLASSPPYPRI